jgi:hypothetical protein
MMNSVRRLRRVSPIANSQGASINKRRWNWHLWVGFLLCLVGFASFPFFARFPATRDVPWVNFLLFAIGGAAFFVGLKRAFGQSQQYRGKIAGSILGTLSLLAVGFFCYIVFYMTRQLPASAGAPHVGQRAPEFVLPDTTNQPVSLASLLSTPLAGAQVPPKGVVLVFYRGYW